MKRNFREVDFILIPPPNDCSNPTDLAPILYLWIPGGRCWLQFVALSSVKPHKFNNRAIATPCPIRFNTAASKKFRLSSGTGRGGIWVLAACPGRVNLWRACGLGADSTQVADLTDGISRSAFAAFSQEDSY